MRSPIIIGGIGGSGTRLVRSLVMRSGAHMGDLVSRRGDSIELYYFQNLFLNPLLSSVGRVDYRLADVPAQLRRSTLAGLSLALGVLRARSDHKTRPWGFKCPRSIYILPFLDRLLPNFVFLHVVRDGRDMVLSENLRQLDLHYASMFGTPVGNDTELAQARLWNRVNDEAARWTAAHLDGRYHVIRFEDLCARPHSTIEALLQFLDAPPESGRIDQVARDVSLPDSIGRWRSLDAARAAHLTETMRDGLNRFGYLP